MNKNIAIYFVGKIFPAAATLLIVLFAIKFLGKEEYGKYTLLFNVIMLIHALAFGWIQQSILRFLSIYNRLINVAIARFFTLTLLASCFQMFILLFLGVFYFYLSFYDLFFIMGFVLLYNIFFFQLCITQSLFQSRKYVALENSYYVLMFIFFFVLFYFLSEKNYLLLFQSMLLALILTQVITFGLLKKKPSLRFSKAFFHRQFIRKSFDYGFPITIWLFGSYLFNIADRFIIKELTGYEEVGIYASVYDIIYKAATFFCIPILLTYHPLIVKNWNEGNKQKAYYLIRKAIGLELIIMLFGLIVFLLIGEIVFNRFINLKLEHLSFISIPLVISAFLWQISLFAHKPLELWFKQKIMLWALFISLIINVATNLVFIPLFNYQIAAYTTLLGTVVYLSVVTIYWNKNQKING